MEFQLIRNATIKINYAGKTILVDPMLCKKETFPPFTKGLLPNPIIDLTLEINDIIDDIDCVLITHLHPDHFDEKSKSILPKDINLLYSVDDKDDLHKYDQFQNKKPIDKNLIWDEIKITRVRGQHGSGPVLKYMGEVSGYILEHKNEPTVYIVSDSILFDNVTKAIDEFKPGIIITNSGGGILPGLEDYPVMMDENQTIEAVQYAQDSKIIAIHLEAIDFCRVTRKSLREAAIKKGISADKLIIPNDGESLSF